MFDGIDLPQPTQIQIVQRCVSETCSSNYGSSDVADTTIAQGTQTSIRRRYKVATRTTRVHKTPSVRGCHEGQ